MMDIHRESLGDDRVVYSERRDGGRKIYNNYQKWVREKANLDEREAKKREATNDMNPNGFYECRFSVQGFQYDSRFAPLFREIVDRDKPVMKIVSQGLTHTDPSYVDRVVYMMRHPRQVAKSQERLQRTLMLKKENGEEFNAYDGIKVHSPGMFINVTVAAAKWFMENPQVPVEIVMFDDLFDNPEKVGAQLQAFHGEGDFQNAMKVVDPNLNRSKPKDIESTLWEDAMFCYENFIQKNFAVIIDYFRDPNRETNAQKKSWGCARAGITTMVNHCRNCINNPDTRANLKKGAEERKIDWRNQPCGYECGMGPNEGITIEESIKNNFWLNDESPE